MRRRHHRRPRRHKREQFPHLRQIENGQEGKQVGIPMEHERKANALHSLHRFITHPLLHEAANATLLPS